MDGCNRIHLLRLLLFAITVLPCRVTAATLQDEFEVLWAPQNVRFEDGGALLQLVLEPSTGGAGFASNDYFLFGAIDMQMKLVPGDSAGTVTAYYLSSETTNHDELDFEFLGNVSGEPYLLQTNIYTNGTGGREQRILLWFDPTTDFHTYSVAWSAQSILFLVDGVPIREFLNIQAKAGVPYPQNQPMRVFSTIWNGDSWATRGGLVKINWADAPFITSYRNFSVAASPCVDATSAAACAAQAAAAGNSKASLEELDVAKLQWVKANYMVYDYCTDKARYPVAPPECSYDL